MSTEFALSEHLAYNHYYDRTFDSEAVKLLPGEYFATASNLVLVTVLGSCVSACLRDRVSGIGGMNHFMLADAGYKGEFMAPSARYGNYAMEILINHLLKLGARRENLEAKLVGGGRVMASLTNSMVGDQNARFAIDYLKTEGIRLVSSDLLDVHPRKLYYFPATGRVLVKKLTRVHNETLFVRERAYSERLTDVPISGDVELF